MRSEEHVLQMRQKIKAEQVGGLKVKTEQLGEKVKTGQVGEKVK